MTDQSNRGPRKSASHGATEGIERKEGSATTPAGEKLRRIMGPNPQPRMLTPYELELLRQAEREIIECSRRWRLEKEK